MWSGRAPPPLDGHNPRVDVHLPCPPLAEWLPRRLEGMRVGAWIPARAPRRARETLARWPSVDDGGVSELDALIFAVALDRPEPPEACLRQLGSGATIVELAVPPLRPLRALLGIDRRPLQRANAAQSRVLQWLSRGYHALEQWESVEPAGIIVTLGRQRPVQ